MDLGYNLNERKSGKSDPEMEYTMNFENRTLFIADNLDIMRGMDSGTIDLIYLDPPFKSGKQWKAPIGSPAEGAEFKDIWTDEDIKYEWHGPFF